MQVKNIKDSGRAPASVEVNSNKSPLIGIAARFHLELGGKFSRRGTARIAMRNKK